MGLGVNDLKVGSVYQIGNERNWYHILIKEFQNSSVVIQIVDAWDKEYEGGTHVFLKSSQFFDRDILLVSENYTPAVGKKGHSHPDKDLRTKHIMESDRKILNELFINLAIDTKDKRWFNNLTKGVEENAN